jgi:hypothetical protein
MKKNLLTRKMQLRLVNIKKQTNSIQNIKNL